MIEHTARGTRFEASPIGFYFAKLWYFERLYPLIFTVGALGAYAGANAGAESLVTEVHRSGTVLGTG